MKAEDSRSEPSLLSQALQKGRRAYSECGVSIILRTHPRAAEIAELVDAAGDRQINFSTAESVLKSIDVQLKAGTISRHTKRECSCDAA